MRSKIDLALVAVQR